MARFKSIPILAWIGLFIAIIVVLQMRLGSAASPNDDAYMSLKVVKNLIAGNGFVYNLGERVYCTTTALYVLLLAGLCRLSGLSPLEAAYPFAVFFDLLNILLLFYIGGKASSHWHAASAVALLFACSYNNALASLGFMETPLFIATLLGTVAAATGDSRVSRIVSGVLAGAATITRPEGAFIVLGLLLYRFYYSKKLPWLETSVAAAIVLPWLIFAFLYFGTILPHSVFAKSLAYSRQTFEAGGVLIQHFIDLFSSSISRAVPRMLVSAVLVIFLWFGVRESICRKSPLIVLYFFTFSNILGYIISNPFIFPWYLVAFESGYLLAVFCGMAFLADRRSEQSSSMKWKKTLFISLGILICLTALSRYYPLPLFPERLNQEDQYGLFPSTHLSMPREQDYLKAAADLAPKLTLKSKILAPEFGAFGYSLKAHIISSIGHVNPEVMEYLPLRPEELSFNHAIPLRMVQGILPDYILTLEIFIRKTLIPDPWFQEHYHIWRQYPSSAFGSKGLLIFEKTKAISPKGPSKNSP